MSVTGAVIGMDGILEEEIMLVIDPEERIEGGVRTEKPPANLSTQTGNLM